MALIRWDPFRDLLSIQERMNRLFDDSIARRRGMEGTSTFAAWSPAVDIVEKENEIELIAELPGIKQEDIKLEVKENVLTIFGERKLKKDVKEENFHRIERSYGKFQRSFSMPGSIKQDEVKATYKDGLLTVILPKVEYSKTKQIDIGDK